ncbi:MAG: Minf_1886 family protein [Planctomycetota bacterium]|jgi:uncharacterized repeat protein (TIGR04138 family)
MTGSSDSMKKVRELAAKEGRHDAQAYLFVFQALEHTLRRIGRRRHVTGQELLKGIKDLALANFGAMGKAVFNQWGVRDSTDFGHIVFALVGAGLMSKTDTDDMSDFSEGFDFDETFEVEYVPGGLSE